MTFIPKTAENLYYSNAYLFSKKKKKNAYLTRHINGEMNNFEDYGLLRQAVQETTEFTVNLP